MPRCVGRDAFPELANEYLKEGKTVVGYSVWASEEGGYLGDNLPRLEVKWVWTEDTNGHAP